MNLKIFILFILNSYFAVASTDICEIRQSGIVEKSIPVPDGVNYFIRGAPATGDVGFATSKGNFILNTQTGLMTSLPGEIDPVLTPDGKFISIPQDMFFDPKTKTYSKTAILDSKGLYLLVRNNLVYNCHKKTEKCTQIKTMTAEQVKKSGKPYEIQIMTFYNRDNIQAGPILYDDSVTHNYQSMSQLRDQKNLTAYRMLYESESGLMIRDYESDTVTKKLKSTGPAKPVCSGKKGVIPSINKTGDEYAAYDADTGVTQIYYIGKSGFDCQLKETIAGLVGKMDFSPDGKFFTYHIDHSMDDNLNKNIIRNANDRNNIEAVVFDREKKQPRTVALADKTNSYYPVFLDNNRLAYIHSNKTNDPQIKPNFSIQLATIQSAANVNCKDCYSADTKSGQLAAYLGSLRMKKCEQQPNYYFKNAVSSFSQISNSQCIDLIKSCDDDCFRQLNESVIKKTYVSGTTINGVSVESVQKWNPEIIKNTTAANLFSFCDQFQNENSQAIQKKNKHGRGIN